MKEVLVERECLKCRKKFISEWAGNRICTRCKSNRSYSVYRSMPDTANFSKKGRSEQQW